MDRTSEVETETEFIQTGLMESWTDSHRLFLPGGLPPMVVAIEGRRHAESLLEHLGKVVLVVELKNEADFLDRKIGVDEQPCCPLHFVFSDIGHGGGVCMLFEQSAQIAVAHMACLCNLGDGDDILEVLIDMVLALQELGLGRGEVGLLLVFASELEQ